MAGHLIDAHVGLCPGRYPWASPDLAGLLELPLNSALILQQIIPITRTGELLPLDDEIRGHLPQDPQDRRRSKYQKVCETGRRGSHFDKTAEACPRHKTRGIMEG